MAAFFVGRRCCWRRTNGAEGRFRGKPASSGVKDMILSGPLCLGSSGDSVRELQKALNGSGVAPKLGVDGRFGARTDRNVRAFQKQKGLKADGVVGPRTSKALGWHYTGQSARPYTLRMQPPLPATTPPLYVVAGAIMQAMDRYHAAITAEVRNSGAPKEWIDKAVNALSVPYDYLAGSLAELKKDTSTPDFLEVTLSQNLLQYQLMVTQVGIWLKEHGGSSNGLARLLDGLQASQMASTVRRFLAGELSAEITISTIDIQVTAVLGTLVAIPTSVR